MASAAERRRRRKTKTAAVAAEVAQDRRAGVTPPATRTARGDSALHRYTRRKTGLDWLTDKGALSPREHRAGEKYGVDYRFSIMESGAALKSSLAALDSPGGGTKGGGLPTTDDCSSMIVQAREAITEARNALNHHTGMVLACDLVCGRGLTPREVTSVRKEAEELEHGLRIALQLLATHYGM